MATRWCWWHERECPESEFKTQLSSKCRVADREANKEHYERNRGPIRARQKEYREKNGAKILYLGAVDRSIVPPTIDEEWVAKHLLHPCPVFGMPFERRTPFAPSLDQFLPRGGYTLENTWVISRLANTIKSNGTSDQILRVALWSRLVDTYQRTLNRTQFTTLSNTLYQRVTSTIKETLCPSMN